MIKSFLRRLLRVKKLSWFERHFIGVIIGAALVAMVISLAIGLAQSVWFDEAYSILVAKQPLGNLLYLTSVDTHPPLYYLLLKGWASIFGWSELALRSLSVLAMGGAVVFGGLLVRRTFGTKLALTTLPFVVLSPMLLRYGFELRPYALASLIGIAATYLLIMALESKTTRTKWLLFGVYSLLVALGMYTLYYTALLWLAHLVWLVWLNRRGDRRPLIRAPWMGAFMVSVVLFLPWLPTFIGQISNGALAPISQPMTLDNLIGIVSFSFVYQPVWQLSPLLSLVIVFVLMGLSYFSIRSFKLVGKAQRPYLLLLALYVLVPVMVLTLVSLVRPMYVERYLSHILIGGSLFVGVAVAIVTQRSKIVVKAVAGLMLIILIVGVGRLAQVGNYNFQRLQKPTVGAVADILKPCDESTTILAADPYVAIELSYYLPNCQIHYYSPYDKLGGGYAPLSGSPLRVSQSRQQLSATRPLYYVHYGETQLEMPLGLRESSRLQFDALTVSRFSVE
ncbi:MAG: glycosyltransferase family 39 protein [Candidatus Saccharibacteria bacterium]